ncbi:MAG: type II secretion system F family protein [Microthrixaceae bacterium]
MRLRPRLVALLAGLGALAVLLGTVAVTDGAGAQDRSSGRTQVGVQQVDARGADVVADGTLVGAEASSLRAEVNGRAVAATVRSGADLPLDVVAVVDSAAALGNGTVQLALDSLAPLLPGAGVADRLGVVTTGGTVRTVAPLTSDAAAVEAGIRTVQPSGGSDTWKGLMAAGEMLRSSGPGRSTAVVLLTATQSAGRVTAGAAETSLRVADARLDVVALPLGTDLATLTEMVGSLGGSLRTVASDDKWAAGTSATATTLGGRFRLSFPPPPGGAGTRDLQVSAGGAATEVQYVPGSLRTGAEALTPATADAGGPLGSLIGNRLVVWLIVLLGAAAVAAGAWALLNMVLPSSRGLARRLEAYEDPYAEAAEEEPAGPDASVTTVPILRRAVDLTGDLAQKRGLLEKLEGDLERANLPLRAAEAIFFCIAGSLVLGVLALLLTRNVMVALMVVLVGIFVPKALLSLKVRKRQKAFEAQLPDMLALMAGTLRAGYSIGQGFEAVSKEMDDPMGRELRRVVTENRLGRPLDEALESVAERMGSEDFSWAVMAIRIQREVGGNLAELLLTVANTMTQRERLRRDVATLTAEGRMSAIVLGILPPALGGVMFVMNPEYIAKLFEPGLGYVLLGAGVIAMLIGFAWMKKIITIEV